MRKSVVLLSVLVLTASLASAAFIQVDEGKAEKANVTEKQSFNEQETQKEATGEPESEKSFLPLEGGELLGDLNLGGNEIEEVETPDDPEDAATKRYVDTRLGNSSGNSTKQGLPSVLLENNVATTSIRFLEGIMLGKGAEAEEGSIAIGENASASNGSVAIGEDARATNRTARIGSDSKPLDLEVTGDLRVEGERDRESVILDSGTVNATEEGVRVLINSESYTVSLTSLNSFGQVAAFNKTDQGFEIRSRNGTVQTEYVIIRD